MKIARLVFGMLVAVTLLFGVRSVHAATQCYSVNTPPGCNPGCTDDQVQYICSAGVQFDVQCSARGQPCGQEPYLGSCGALHTGSCVECTGTDTVCDNQSLNFITSPCTAECSHLDGCVCSEECGGSIIEHGQTCPNNPSPPPASCEFGGWRQCSESCGPGITSRSDGCGNTQTAICNLGECSGSSCVWGEWGGCTAPCGGGFQVRSDTCGNSQIQTCNNHSCNPSCTWEPWSACSESCGGGTRTRNNTCGATETQPCNTQACSCPNPSFGPWSGCSAACGGGGTRVRDQFCNGVLEGQETEACNDFACVSQDAWFQTQGGHSFAGNTTGTAINSEVSTSIAVCGPAHDTQAYSIFDDADTSLSDGFATSGGGAISTNGFSNERTIPTVVHGTANAKVKEGYEFFYLRSDLGNNPVEHDFGDEDNATRPANSGIYFRKGNLEITDRQPWQISSGESITVFIDGTLRISDGSNLGQIITVEPGGFLAFIVRGNVFVRNNVGTGTPSGTEVEGGGDFKTSIEGIYVADQQIIISAKREGVPDEKFIGAGVFVGWQGVQLNRSFSDGSPTSTLNACYNTEQFVYRPDLIENTPAWMKRAPTIWQETN